MYQRWSLWDVNANADWDWNGISVATTENYFYVHHSLVVSNDDQSIQTTTKIIEGCFLDDQECQTELGYLVWESRHIRKSRLKKGLSTSCILIDTRLSCPEEYIAITDPATITLCNKTFGYSAQGIIFTMNEPWKTMNFSVSRTETIDEMLKHDEKKHISGDITKFRNCSRGETWNGTVLCGDTKLPPPSFYPAPQINSKLQYLYDLIKTNITFNIQHLHQEVCRTNKRQLEMLRILAQGGSTSLMVRVLLDNDDYRARLNGDVLSIYKCNKIYHYMFEPRDGFSLTGQCYTWKEENKEKGFYHPCHMRFRTKLLQ